MPLWHNLPFVAAPGFRSGAARRFPPSAAGQ